MTKSGLEVCSILGHLTRYMECQPWSLHNERMAIYPTSLVWESSREDKCGSVCKVSNSFFILKTLSFLLWILLVHSQSVKEVLHCGERGIGWKINLTLVSFQTGWLGLVLSMFRQPKWVCLSFPWPQGEQTTNPIGNQPWIFILS